ARRAPRHPGPRDHLRCWLPVARRGDRRVRGGDRRRSERPFVLRRVLVLQARGHRRGDPCPSPRGRHRRRGLRRDGRDPAGAGRAGSGGARLILDAFPAPTLVFGPPEDDLREEIRAWLRANAAGDPPSEYAARLAVLTEWQRALHAAGFIGLSWPERYGGRGL